MLPIDLSPLQLLAVSSLVINSIILTFYFTELLRQYGAVRTSYREGFVISFSGITVGTFFTFLVPTLPTFIPSVDLGAVLVFFTWVMLTRYYCKTSLIHTLAVTIVAAIIHIVLLSVISVFVTLLFAQ